MRLQRGDGQRKNAQQMSCLSRSMLVYECTVKQLLYSNCLCPHCYSSVILLDVHWRTCGQMLMTLVAQVFHVSYLMESFQMPIKQHKVKFHPEFCCRISTEPAFIQGFSLWKSVC